MKTKYKCGENRKFLDVNCINCDIDNNCVLYVGFDFSKEGDTYHSFVKFKRLDKSKIKSHSGSVKL